MFGNFIEISEQIFAGMPNFCFLAGTEGEKIEMESRKRERERVQWKDVATKSKDHNHIRAKMGARVLSTGNFYGSSMPRPFLLPSVQWVGKNLKLVTFENQNSRVNRPQSPTSILLEWAEEAPWKQGGLSASTKTEYKQSLKRTIRKQQKAAKKKKISKKKVSPLLFPTIGLISFPY